MEQRRSQQKGLERRASEGGQLGVSRVPELNEESFEGRRSHQLQHALLIHQSEENGY